MSGKELILYILLNDLEDEQIDKDGKLLGFITVEEAAIKHNVGTATVKAWIDLGRLPSITIGDTILVPEFFTIER